MGAGIGLGRIGGQAAEAIARQPEASGEIRGAALLFAVLLEGATIIALVFALLAIVIFYFAWDPTAIGAIDLAPGVLWVIFAFSGLLGLHRSFGVEQADRAIELRRMADGFMNRQPEVRRLEDEIVRARLDALRRQLLGRDRRPPLGVAGHVERLDVLPSLAARRELLAARPSSWSARRRLRAWSCST